MTKLMLRAALAGCATAAVATAQTTPPPPIHVQPPVPVPTMAVRVVIPPAPAKMVLKTFDVAELVCPPADSPLAKPGTDPAMIAAAKAFTDVRTEQLLKALRADDAFNFWGMMEFTTDGKTLVVNCPEPVANKIGECVSALRTARHSQVKVNMTVFTVSSGNEAMVKLFGDKPTAAVKVDEFNKVLRELKASGAVDILTRPTLVLTNKQTGFFQVGQPLAVPGGIACATVGTTARITPDVSADLKFLALALDIQHSDFTGGKVDCQQTQTKLVMPDGGTMLVKVGTRLVERRSENKVPVLGDVPYLDRLFRNVGISTESTDTVAVVTVTRLAEAPCVVPPPVAVVPPIMPTAVPFATPLAAPVPVMLPLPIRPVGADGLERVGVNFDTLTTPVALPPAVQRVRFTAPAGVSVIRFLPSEPQAFCGGMICATVSGDDTTATMAAYKAACAAGRTDDATRLGLQLLAKDPTCFGK